MSDKLQFLANYNNNYCSWSFDSYSNILKMMDPFVFTALWNATKKKSNEPIRSQTIIKYFQQKIHLEKLVRIFFHIAMLPNIQ